MTVTLSDTDINQFHSAASTAVLTMANLTGSVGDLMVVTIAVNDVAVPGAPSGWLTAVSSLDSSAGFDAFGIYYRLRTGTETSTYTWTFSTSSVYSLMASDWNDSAGGLWTLDKHPAANDQTGNGTSAITNTTGTLSQAVEVAIAACLSDDGFGSGDGGTRAINSSFTRFGTTANDVGVSGYLITAATTALAPTMSWASSVDRSAGIATWYPQAVPHPSAAPLTLTVSAPTITLTGAVGPSAVPHPLSVKLPAITTTGQSSPSAAPLTLAVLTPTAAISQAVTPAVVAMTLAVKAPSPVAGTIAFPSTVAMVLSVKVPALQASTALTPAVVPLTLTAPGPLALPVSMGTPNVRFLTLTIQPPTLYSTPDGVVRLSGRFLDDDGNPSTGVLRFFMPTPLTDVDSLVQSEPTSVEVTLDATGSFTVTLTATDRTDLTPAHPMWVVTEYIDRQSRTYEIPLTGSPPIQDLADLAPLF